MSLTAAIHHTSHSVSSKPPAVFEFTKRKKWADILISELSGSVLVVLNKDSNVLWASPAVTELLGWREDELAERSIREFLHDDDAAPFAEHLKKAVDSRSELFTYVRIKTKFTSPRASSHPSSPHSPTAGSSNSPSPTLSSSLFELRGHAIYSKTTSTSDPGPSGSSSSLGESSAEPDASCFIIMARPYPSRNTAMLDSFLELKIENERLRQQLLNLKTSGGASSPTVPSPAFPISQIAPLNESPRGQPLALSSPVYPTSNMSGLNLAGASASGDADAAYQPHSIHAMPQPPSAYYPTQGNRYASGTFDGMHPPSTFGAGPGPAVLSARRGSIAEEAQGEASERTRKKPKKAHTVQEQYVCVTCGRTDSPEWRKGPLGAKTLCNACGLRWAKRNSKRKTDDLAGAEGGG